VRDRRPAVATGYKRDGALDPLVDFRFGGSPNARLGHATCASRTISATPVETLWESGVVYAVVMLDSECFSGLHCDRAHTIWRRPLVFCDGVLEFVLRR
jgi:hypothetical protein